MLCSGYFLWFLGFLCSVLATVVALVRLWRTSGLRSVLGGGDSGGDFVSKGGDLEADSMTLSGLISSEGM